MTTIKPKSQIEIYTDKELYEPGQTVNGKVLLRIKKDFKAKQLFIALIGEIYCKTHIHCLDKKLGKWIDTDIKEQKKTLLTIKSKLIDFDTGKLPKGEINVKYSFTLPDNLDYASTYCKGQYGINRDSSQHYSQYVKYLLRAWIPKSKKKYELVGKQPIHIKLEQKFNLPKNVYIKKDFTFCYCISTGFLELGLKLNQTEYNANEKIFFSFEYDNYPATKRKPLSLRWQIIRKLVFNGEEFVKHYSQGELENPGNKKHESSVELPLAMTMTHKSTFCCVQNMIRIEYCLPDDEIIAVEQEFAVNQCNPPRKKSGESELESMASRVSDADREELIAQDVNWYKCNSKLEDLQ